MPVFAVEAANLSVGYGKTPVLTGLSLAVRPGELLGIIGPNGAGKSTLLKTLRGLLAPLAGRVTLLGRKAASLSERDFARLAAYLQQRLEVEFAYTAEEIVLAGRYPYLAWWQGESERDRQIVQAALQYTGVLSLATRPASAMSGGQLQRVLLAKVLAQQTPLLFLDEPATGLDLVYQEEIFRFAQGLAKAGKTVLVVAHELTLAARFCSRLVLLADGGLLADGPPEEVLTEELLSRAYQAPVRVAQNPLTGHVEIYTEGAPTDAGRQELLQTLLEN